MVSGMTVNVLNSSLTYLIIQLSRCTNCVPFKCTRSLSVACASPHIKLNDFNKTYQIQFTSDSILAAISCAEQHRHICRSHLSRVTIKCAKGRMLYIKFLKTVINALECMNVSLSYRTTNMFWLLTCHLQGGKNKNRVTITMCWNQFPVKKCIYFG